MRLISNAFAFHTVRAVCDDGYLYAHGLRNGAEKWSFEIGKKTHRDLTPFLVRENGIVYFGHPIDGIYSLDTHEAERGYTEHDLFQTGGVIASTPAIEYGNTFFGSGDGHVYAVNVVSNQEIWRFKAGAAITSSPAILGKLVFSGDLACNFYSVELQTGKKVWNFSANSPIRSSVAVNEDTVYFGVEDGSFLGLDTTTTEPKVCSKFPGAINSSPSIVKGDGTIYFGSDDGSFYAVDRQLKKKLEIKTGGHVRSSPAIAGTAIYFGSDEGALHILR